ncbi:MAG: DUF1385 domain-containing protein [Deltaproteobacteria bacterium]|jgi:uncharacterized protein YqhQ|nr:DUF1385 domain-containing protein [Deltaproteobacteria bacterium]
MTDVTKLSRLFAYIPFLSILLQKEQEESLAVGGQAVMEGVMMRNGDNLSIAVRQPQGNIVVQNKPWFCITKNPLFKRPYLRGFPLLMETMINGIKALNVSAELAIEAEGEELKPWQLILTLGGALLFAVALFVVAPHLITVALSFFHISGEVEGFSFHLWDGLIKFGIFLLYICAISRIKEINRVFQYHGAEHKAISAFESGLTPINSAAASRQSRLHPRCGTTFLLFVLCIAISLHILVVPLLLFFWTPDGSFQKHFAVILLKLLLMLPISALAYEAIRFAARLGNSMLGRWMRAPGLLLQTLTTREPDSSQLEVALVSLKEALKADEDFDENSVETQDYTILEPTAV